MVLVIFKIFDVSADLFASPISQKRFKRQKGLLSG